MKNPSSKLIRMRLDLEEYDFTIEYLRRKDNYVADALSRITINDLKEMNNSILKVTTRSMTNKHANNDNNTVVQQQKIDENKNNKPSIYEPLNNTDVRKYYKLKISPGRCYIKRGKSIVTYIQINDLFTNGNLDLGQFFPRLEKVAGEHNIYNLQVAPSEKIFEFISFNDFKIMGNNVLKKIKVALLKQVTQINNKNAKAILDILQKYHDDPIEGGHCGIYRTTQKIRRYYYWKNMSKDISNYVKACHKCQIAKTTKHIKCPMTITETPDKPFDIVYVDTVGPFPRSIQGNEYAITLICDLTKYLVTIPIQDKSAKTIAKAIFENFILTYGPMKTFISDMGTEYKNSILSEICKLLKIEKLISTAHHHQTLGTIERSHRTFNEYVRSYISVDKTDWDIWIKYFTYCFNTTPSTVHNYCPYELVFSKLPNSFTQFDTIDRISPLYNIDDYAKEAKFRIEVAHKRAQLLLNKNKFNSKEIYDKNTINCNLKIGDLVLLRNESGHKIEPNYKGPFQIVNIDLRNNITIVDKKTNKEQIVHKNRLKIYHDK